MSARLVYMANQIEAFFAAQPGGGAAEAIAGHLKAFWTPAMRGELIAFVAAGGEGLRPLAADAAALLGKQPSTPWDGGRLVRP